MNERMKKFKRMMKKLKKEGIEISSFIDKTEQQILKNKRTFDNFIKLAKRVLERPKIVEESKKITERMRERVKAKKETDKKKQKEKQNLKNEIFLNKYPQFRQVFKYDTKRNKSGDAQKTADLYMYDRRQSILSTIYEQFPNISDEFKKKLEEVVNMQHYSIDYLVALENVSENLFYKRDSGGEDCDYTFGAFNSIDDEMANRLLNRFHKASLLYK